MITAIMSQTKDGFLKSKDLPILNEVSAFRTLTYNKTLIVGRRTYSDLDRDNVIVLGRTGIDSSYFVNNLDLAIQLATIFGREIFIVGGIYTFFSAISILDRVVIIEFNITGGEVYNTMVSDLVLTHDDYPVRWYAKTNNFGTTRV